MANKEKIELKTLLYQEEIKEYERQLVNLDQQKHEWIGYGRAYSDANEVFKILFKDLKYALDWMSLDEEEKEKLLKEDPKCLPKVEVTEQEGFKIAEYLKPAHQLVSIRMQKAKAEPGMFEAQKNVINRQIDRLNRLIAAEQNKALEEETEADVLEDPWNELNKDESESQKEQNKQETADSSDIPDNGSGKDSGVVKMFGKKNRKKNKKK